MNSFLKCTGEFSKYFNLLYSIQYSVDCCQTLANEDGATESFGLCEIFVKFIVLSSSSGEIQNIFQKYRSNRIKITVTHGND